MAGFEADDGISESGSSRNGTKCDEETAVSVSGKTGTFGGEEISPDLLKNTPSNIARLEDEIEHCQGRKKYLAQTGSPSDGSDVRWFFCKVSLAENELSASVPRKEIVGKSEYFRFGMRDSLAIEASFLQREEECLSSWWKEYAECSEGPRGSTSSHKMDADQNVSCSDGAQSGAEVEEERVGVPVKGGLYEVDLLRRHCFPVYWNGDNKRVLRGHWFACKGGLDWLPLREDVSEQLEFAYRGQVWHRRTFQPSGLFAARIDLQGSTPGLHALFTGDDDTWEAWLNGDASGFSGFIGLGGNGIKLRRGYSPPEAAKPTQDELRQQKEEEMDDYCSKVPVRHVIFVVHGIGQRMEKSNFVDDVGNLRTNTAGLAERHLTSHQRDAQRVLYIPCQWRRGLKLSGESTVEKITLEGVRGLRVMLSATVHDVLYYMSPIYCQDIINSVSNQLNRLYLQFIKRNPGYDGKVSIFGHSLGSVLSYDILCHQEKLSSPFQMNWMYKEPSTKEKSHIQTNDQYCKSTPSTNIRDEISGLLYETKDKVVSIDEDTGTPQGTLLGHHVDDSSFNEYHVSPDQNESSTWAMDSTQLNAQEDTYEAAFNSRNRHSDTKDELDLSTSKGPEVVPVDSGKMDDEVPYKIRDNGTEVKLLKEEIDSLRARIAELESLSYGKDASEKLTSGKENTPKSYSPQIHYTKLEFKVDTFFAVGSPLGVFLALRNIRIGMGKSQDYWEENIVEEMPACRRIFNIFHPFDPVAYRIEPLICKECIGKPPVIIPYHKGGRRLHIGIQEFAQDLAARSQAMVDRLHSVRDKFLMLCQSQDRDCLEDVPEIPKEEERRSYGLLMMERVTGSEDGRVDHVLQDKTFEHAYISAIGSHTNYWRDFDTALFVLKHLYQEIPEDDPNSPCESDGSISKHNTNTKSLTGRRDATVEEQLPLTFSDSALVRTFSRKAKKLLKKPAS